MAKSGNDNPRTSSTSKAQQPPSSSARVREDSEHRGSPKPLSVPSYLGVPNLPPSVRTLCEILSRCPGAELESALEKSGIPPLPHYVEQVLKLSYGDPKAAVKFFRWAGRASDQTPCSWNVMVDILGRNRLFEDMWDAIRAMKREKVLTPSTFVFAFDSYCAAGRIKEAVMTFDVMDRYGIAQDVVAVNSLLSAVCRHGDASSAVDFFERVKPNIPPDADSFAILLEGLEREGNLSIARKMFDEMISRVGWNSSHMPAYDAFLTTLLRGSEFGAALRLLRVMKSASCVPGMNFFHRALGILASHGASSHAISLWEIMVDCGLAPDISLYNALIIALCGHNEFDMACRYLDEMVLNGVFPDSITYNTIFNCLIKARRLREAASFFSEMMKNEWPPAAANCDLAIKLFLESDDPEMAVEVWSSMIEYKVAPNEEGSNLLLDGLRHIGRLVEARRLAGEMLDRGIGVHPSTMAKLKLSFPREERMEAYGRLARR